VIIVPAQQPFGREPQIVECGADTGQIIPRFRVNASARSADEQANPQFFLKPPDLMADRGFA